MTDAERAEQAIDHCMRIIKKYVTDTDRKDQVDRLLENFGERMFLAPASTKEDHHSAYKGGLIVHSMRVTQRIFDICNGLGLKNDEVPHESKVIVGIFHDIGKIGSYDGIPHYLTQNSDWHRETLGQYYKYNEELNDGLTTSQRSIRILTKLGLDLTDSEYISILFHDGLYVKENDSYSMKGSEDKLMRITHMADSYVALIENI